MIGKLSSDHQAMQSSLISSKLIKSIIIPNSKSIKRSEICYFVIFSFEIFGVSLQNLIYANISN